MRHFFLLELAVYIRGVWTEPRSWAEVESDEETYLLQLTRLVVIALTIEGVLAVQIINFLWTHGQI